MTQPVMAQEKEINECEIEKAMMLSLMALPAEETAEEIAFQAAKNAEARVDACNVLLEEDFQFSAYYSGNSNFPTIDEHSIILAEAFLGLHTWCKIKEEEYQNAMQEYYKLVGANKLEKLH